ncbi:hypothetical protein FACS1894133_1480 [Clostridia bacterium]|nr:hypothetical protein FACS1894133_1480 [Clostridia bacterium]
MRYTFSKSLGLTLVFVAVMTVSACGNASPGNADTLSVTLFPPVPTLGSLPEQPQSEQSQTEQSPTEQSVTGKSSSIPNDTGTPARTTRAKRTTTPKTTAEPEPAQTALPAQTAPPTQIAPPQSDVIADLFAQQASDVQVEGNGVVTRILADDNDGDRHQRFILKLKSGQTLLIAHNIDIAPRLDGIAVGDSVTFFGEYVYNANGGTVHWTHHDPGGRHTDGWLKWGGRTYG